MSVSSTTMCYCALHTSPNTRRFPQLRESTRTPGKYRWVLYEMWPLRDPITQQQCVLVCEQNITQVKSLEEEFRRQNRRLEEQLEEALTQRDLVHKSAIDIDTPADKTLKLLDKIMRGHEVTASEAMDLHDAIVRSGDLRQPVNFNEQVLEQAQGGSMLDKEVGQSLIQLLSSRKTVEQQQQQRSTSTLEIMSPVASSASRSTSTASSSNIDRVDVQETMSMVKEPSDDLMVMLAKADGWQFDAFELNEVSGGRPLSFLGYFLFKRFELIEKFGLDEVRLVQFLMRVEEGYPSNSYHNRIHAADVLQSLHVLLFRGGLMQSGYCDDISLVSCFLSAIVHDYQHKGVNNDYLVRTGDGLAILYNDRCSL